MGEDVQYIQDYCWNRSYHLQDVPQPVLDPCLQKSLKEGGEVGGRGRDDKQTKNLSGCSLNCSLNCNCWKTKAESSISSAEGQF